MPPKPQPKNLEDILQAIQDRLATIQTQMEANETRHTNIEHKMSSSNPFLAR